MQNSCYLAAEGSCGGARVILVAVWVSACPFAKPLSASIARRAFFPSKSVTLLAGTRPRFSGFNQIRQCGDDVLRMLVTGGPPVRGDGVMPHRIIVSSRLPSDSRITGAGKSGNLPSMPGILTDGRRDRWVRD
jgi:hypothetical protein